MSDLNSRITKLERKDIEALGEPYVDLINPGDDVSFPTLDLSDSKFNLRTLENVHFVASECPAAQKSQARRRIIEINVSNNQLQSLADLCESHNELMFVGAKLIIAENNMIQYMCMTQSKPQGRRWPKRMDALKVLKLGQNRLDEFPDCQNMQHLEVLHLNNNNIKSANQTVKRGLEDLAKHCHHLRELRLDSNDINWTPKQFADEHKAFRSNKLKQLRVLRISNNPFCMNIRLYEVYILRQATKLQDINGREVTDALKSRAKTIRQFDTLLLQQGAGDDDNDDESSKVQNDDMSQHREKELSVDAEEIHSLEQLEELLESCFADPLNAVKMVHKFLTSARLVASSQRSMDLLFVGASTRGSGKTGDDTGSVEDDPTKKESAESEKGQRVESQVQSLLQSIKVLMERQPNLTPALTKALAHLSGVYSRHCKRFGKLCLSQLLNIYEGRRGSANRQEEVESVLSRVLVRNLAEMCRSSARNGGSQDREEIKKSLMEGLTDMIMKAPRLSKAMGAMARDAAGWLGRGSNDIKLHQLDFLAAITLNRENVKDLTQGDVPVHRHIVMRRLTKEIAYDQTTISLLKIATNVCERSERSAMELCSPKVASSKGLHVMLCDEIKKLKPAPGENWHMEKICVCSQLLRCLASVSRLDVAFEAIFKEKVLSSVGKYVIKQQPPMHPMIVASSLKLLTSILQQLREKRNASSSDGRSEWLERQKNISRKYVDDPSRVLNMIDDRNVLYSRLCDQVVRHRGFGVKNEDGALLDFKDMDNPDMQDLFVEVAKFVQFYSLAAHDPHNEDAIGVAEEMDDSNREGILLRCLSIPSYDVRLAVTTCLTHVGCEQLQLEEINTLLMHVRNTENISAGETEIVLSKIFNIFSKLVLSESDPDNLARHSHMEMMSCAWDFLSRNMRRVLSRDDSIEIFDRYVLSKSCVDFLIAVSAKVQQDDEGRVAEKMVRSENLARWVEIIRCEDRQTKMVRIASDVIENEESKHRSTQKVSELQRYYPIPLERCIVGRKVRYLLAALKGLQIRRNAVDDESKEVRGAISWNIRPTGLVAQRIVARLADVLEGIPDPLQKDLKRVLNITPSSSGSKGESSKRAIRGEGKAQDATEPYTFYCDLSSRVPRGLAELYFSSSNHSSDMTEKRRQTAQGGKKEGYNNVEESESEVKQRQWYEGEIQRERVLRPYFFPDIMSESNLTSASSSTSASQVSSKNDKSRREMYEQQRVFFQGGGIETLVSFMASGAPVDLSTYGIFGRGSDLADDLMSFCERPHEMGDEEEEEHADDDDDDDSKERKGETSEMKKIGLEEMHRLYMSTDLNRADAKSSSSSPSNKNATSIGTKKVSSTETSRRAHIVASGLRALCATLQLCKQEDRGSALRQLRQIELLQLLFAVVKGDPAQPDTSMWLRCGVGAKFVLLLEAILSADFSELMVGTSELGDTERDNDMRGGVVMSNNEVRGRRQIQLMELSARAVSEALSAVSSSISGSSNRASLSRHDNELVYATSRLCILVCRIIPLVKPIRSQKEENRVRACQWLFSRLFSKTTLESVIRIVLEDLRSCDRKTKQGLGQSSDGGSKSKQRSSRKSSRHESKHKSGKRNISLHTKIRNLKFDAFLLQNRRGYLVDVLVQFLVNMRSERFGILERFVSSSELTRLPTSFVQHLLDTLGRCKYKDAFEAKLADSVLSEMDDEIVLLTRWVDVWTYRPNGGKMIKSKKRLLVLTQHRMMMFKEPGSSWVSSLWKRSQGSSWPDLDSNLFDGPDCPLQHIRSLMSFRGSHRVAFTCKDPSRRDANTYGVQFRLTSRDEASSLRDLIFKLSSIACRRFYLPYDHFPKSIEDPFTVSAIRLLVKDDADLSDTVMPIEYAYVKDLKSGSQRILLVLFDPSNPDASKRGTLLLLNENCDVWWYPDNGDEFANGKNKFYGEGSNRTSTKHRLADLKYISLSQTVEPSLTMVFDSSSGGGSDSTGVSLLFATDTARQAIFRVLVECYGGFEGR